MATFIKKTIEENRDLVFSPTVPFAPGKIGMVVKVLSQVPLGSTDLTIEELSDEVTMFFDYSHVHFQWPLRGQKSKDSIWRNPRLMLDAILAEEVLATSGWIGGQLKLGTLHLVNDAPDLIVPNLEIVRTRSWLGTYDRDENLIG